MKKLAAFAMAASLAVSGCANMPGQAPPGELGVNKTTGGTMLGAIGGGLAGAQFGHGSGTVAMAAVGTLLGAFLGHEVGTSLDRADQMAEQNAEQKAYAAPIGHSITWNNPDTGHSGTITPVREGTDASGQYCREFQQHVVIQGQSQAAYVTACRQPDGTWKVES